MAYTDFDKIAITILIFTLLYFMYNSKTNNDDINMYSFRPIQWAY